MLQGQLIIRRAWRSQLKRLAIYVVLAIACIVLSRQFPRTIVDGPLFTIGSHQLFLSLPLLSFLPLAALMSLIWPIYDGYFKIDNRGVELKTGVLSINQKIVRVRYEDIRSIEVAQSILDRVLDVGTIGVASAATEGIEIAYNGVAAPREIQDLMQSERDRRLRLADKQVFNEVAVGD